MKNNRLTEERFDEYLDEKNVGSRQGAGTIQRAYDKANSEDLANEKSLFNRVNNETEFVDVVKDKVDNVITKTVLDELPVIQPIKGAVVSIGIVTMGETAYSIYLDSKDYDGLNYVGALSLDLGLLGATMVAFKQIDKMAKHPIIRFSTKVGVVATGAAFDNAIRNFILVPNNRI